MRSLHHEQSTEDNYHFEYIIPSSGGTNYDEFYVHFMFFCSEVTLLRTFAKPHQDATKCNVHVDIHYNVPIFVATVFLKIIPGFRNVYM